MRESEVHTTIKPLISSVFETQWLVFAKDGVTVYEDFEEADAERVRWANLGIPVVFISAPAELWCIMDGHLRPKATKP